jgi:UDP-N-acetylglucosamine--N-acetylmuramyl-(pentapeptide) pyrophosphoryl-undecaprenol N-acetylglucosamine transferase
MLKPTTELLWVGSETGLEKDLVARADIPYRGISAAGLRGKNPAAALVGLIKLLRGYWQSRRLMADYQPDVLFVTGGYVCAPITLAAHRAGIPVVIYLPDIQPGQAIKFLSRYATKIAVTAPPAQAFFPPGLTVVTGYPVRKELYNTDRRTARARLNLASNRPTILIFGGSQGARSINKAIARPKALAELLAQGQIIHLTGRLDADWTQAVKEALPEALKRHYHLYPYLHQEMTDAFAAADLIISRAGASILGEAPAAGAPSILAPYPYSGAHQWPNAQYLADQGAAIIVADDELEKSLVKTALDLLNNTDKRLSMAAAARRLARPQATHAIAAQLEEVCYDKCVRY